MLQAYRTRVISREDWGADIPLVRGEGTCTPIIWPGMGATARSLHLLVLGPASRTIRMRHPSEAVYYVVEGEAQITDHDTGSSRQLVAGSMAHVEAGTTYGLHTDAVGARILGGPCPPDPALYAPNLDDAMQKEG